MNNIYLLIILTILIGNYLLRLVIEILNISSAKLQLPAEFKGYYDSSRYKKSQAYLKENTYLNLIHHTILTAIIVILILSGGFNFLDQMVRSLNLNPLFTGLIFAGILFFGFQIIEIPFSIYHTFIIEAKYEFNRMSIKTFISDTIKGWILAIAIGGILLYAVMWFFMYMGQWAWLWCWIGVGVFGFLITFIAPLVIMPLFNRFTPLEEGELKEAIENYIYSEKFKLRGIFKIDGSRRSNKSNAFFTGFGKSRRIALFDTLIQKHPVNEIVSILAHEVGHYKRRHILKRMFILFFTRGLMFFLLSLFINNPGLFRAFRMEQISVYASLIFFGFLYAPINLILSLGFNIVSRQYEYEADRYAVSTYKHPQTFISALKRLSIDNLSNLTPHPLKVFFDYSHPPVLKRLEAIEKFKVITTKTFTHLHLRGVSG